MQSTTMSKAAALAIAFAMSTAYAEEPGVVVAGGELDAGFSGADVYVGVPARAEAPSGKACQAAQSYVDLINAGRFREVVELFEEGAVVLEPTRRILRGRNQIREFYEGTIGTMRPEVTAVAYLGDDKDCMVELAARMKVRDQLRHMLVSIDHFTLGAGGRITRMVAFARPPRTE